MPANILHTLFGNAVISELYNQISTQKMSELKKAQERYAYVFALGCQGPDIFYHSRMTRPFGIEYGALLHRRGFGNFTAALMEKTLLQKDVTSLSVYVLGFMTHAFLDRACHPYVVYKSFPDKEKEKHFCNFFSVGKAHGFFERILDVLMLELLKGIQVSSSWEQFSLIEICDNPPCGLKKLLEETLIEVFPEKTSKDKYLSERISNAFKDCAEFHRLTNPQKTSFRNSIAGNPIPLVYIYPEKLPLYIDYLNLKHEKWFYPAGKHSEYTFSFLEIYNNAIKIARDAVSNIIIPYFESGIFSFEKAIYYLGNEGLSINDENGKPCMPNKTSFLPLDEVFLQQSRYRY